MKYVTSVNGKEFNVEILDDHHITIDGNIHEVDFVTVADQPVFSLIMDRKSHEAFILARENELQLLIHGRSFSINIIDEQEKRLRAVGGNNLRETTEFILRSPMPGLVISLPVPEGQEVKKGEVLVILESMKMQNELKSPREGVLTRVKVQPGDNVEQRQILLSVE